MTTKTFETSLAELTLNAVKQITLYKGLIDSFSWEKRRTKVLNFLINEDIITHAQLLEAIDVLLKRVGRSCYEEHRNGGQYPDHTSSPQAFAYALKHGELSFKEARIIKFDHGETQQSFVESYLGAIEYSVMRQLTTN